MSVAGYRVSIRRAGTPTAFADETMSTIALQSSATQASAFQIGSSLRDIWDRESTVTFTASSGSTTPISSTDIQMINFLFGRVYFKSSHSAVFANGTYIPMQSIAGGHAFTLTLQQDMLDDTDFDSVGYRSKTPGLADVQLSVTRYDTLNTFFDNIIMHGIHSTSGSTIYTKGAAIVAEVQTDPDNSGPIARGWFKIETNNRSGDVGALETAEINLALASIGADDSSFVKTFSWNDI